MPRAPRIVYPGAVYHLLCRGDRSELIFLDEEDRERFLDTLAETCERTGWKIHAYVLMGNHYHLLTETLEPNLVEGMKWFQGTYTQRFNRRHRKSGHLFQGRYKALVVEGTGSNYFRTVADYIHLNPVRAGLLDRKRPDVRSYPWSSAPYFGRGRRHLSNWLEPDAVFRSMGIEADEPAGRRRFAALLNAKARAILESPEEPEWAADWARIRRGWYLGEKRFRDRLLGHLEKGMRGAKRGSYSGSGARAHDKQRAEKLLEVGLKHLGLSRTELDRFRKNDVHKQVLAAWIRGQTVVGNEWLAERLHMGTASGVSRYIGEVKRSPTKEARILQARLKSARIED